MTRQRHAQGRRHRAWPRHAAGLRRRRDLVAPARRQVRRAADHQVQGRRSADARSPATCRAATAPTARSIADQWVDPKEQRRIDDFILFGLAAAAQAVKDSGYEPKTEEERDRTGVLIGSGIGGLAGHRGSRDAAARKGPAPHQPVLHSGPADQSRFGLRLDPLRLQGPEPCGGHGLRHRRACDRRRGAADRARRCRS